MNSRECGDSPETLCAAKDRPSSARRSAIGVMLKNRAPILHHHHRSGEYALGIFCGVRAIGRANFRERTYRSSQQKQNNPLVRGADSENHVAFVRDTDYDTTRLRRSVLGSARLWRIGFGVAPKQAFPDTLRFVGPALR